MKYFFKQGQDLGQTQFNRERLILAAIQELEQLYYMMDTQFEGIYQSEAIERKRMYGSNEIHLPSKKQTVRLPGLQRKEIEALLDKLSKQKPAVFRKGIKFYQETDNENLVPGDVIFLTRGDIVPADVRVIFERELAINQKLFTRDDTPVKKLTSIKDYTCTMASSTGLPNICLMGTTVVEGMALGVVLGTGKSTYLYKMLTSD